MGANRQLTVLESPAITIELVDDSSAIAAAADSLLVGLVEPGLCQDSGQKSVGVFGLCGGTSARLAPRNCRFP